MSEGSSVLFHRIPGLLTALVVVAAGLFTACGDDNGDIVTNNHVVSTDSGDAAQDITVTLDEGSEHKAKIAGRDPPTDVAVLQIDGGNLKPATLGDSSKLEVGDDVIAIGNALDLPGG